MSLLLQCAHFAQRSSSTFQHTPALHTRAYDHSQRVCPPLPHHLFYSCPRTTARASGVEAPLLLSFFFLFLLDQSTRFSSFLLPSLSANVRCVCTLGLWRCTRLSMMILTQMRGPRSPRKSRFVVCCKGNGRVFVTAPDASVQQDIEVFHPVLCATSDRYIAVVVHRWQLLVYAHTGGVVYDVPDAHSVSSLDFHPHCSGILVYSSTRGSVIICDVERQVQLSTVKEHTYGLYRSLFSTDGRLFMASADKTASIVTLDHQFQVTSRIILQGHTSTVKDILPLTSYQCVTCSFDTTLKVWDCQTGECLRTLHQDLGSVEALALHPSANCFASGSAKEYVLIWSIKTFEILHCIKFPQKINSLVFDEDALLCVGVRIHGVMSCNALTGELGSVIIPESGVSCLKTGTSLVGNS